ncbi:MAG TPA: carboxymuconolactone decarboxylase family protein [Kineosporiaceae bacterium]
MAVVELLSADQVPPEVSAVFEAVEREYGFVPNILRAMSHSPELLVSFVPLWAQVYASPAIGPRLRALAALGTAKAQDCSYCVTHMTASARRAGVSDEELAAVGVLAAQQAVFAEREALMLNLADTLTRDPDGVTDELRSRLASEFAPDELVTVVLAVGMYNLTSRFLKALDIEVEDVFQASAPSPSA